MQVIINKASVTDIAKQRGVSRKFIHRQKDKATAAINQARLETRKIWVSSQLNDYLDFPHAGQALCHWSCQKYKLEERHRDDENAGNECTTGV